MKSATIIAAAAVAVLGAATLAAGPAHADWWSRNVAPIGKAINRVAIDFGKGLEKTVQAIAKNPVEILPVCWGAPQECRDPPGDTVTSGGGQLPGNPTYYVTYRVDCVDRDGNDRGDQTLTVYSPISVEAARREALLQDATTDLCQGTGDTTRFEVPGSARFI